MTRWSDQVAISDEENGRAFFGMGKFGPVDQVFYGRKTNAVFCWSNFTDEVLKVVFVGEVLGDDDWIVRFDNEGNHELILHCHSRPDRESIYIDSVSSTE